MVERTRVRWRVTSRGSKVKRSTPGPGYDTDRADSDAMIVRCSTQLDEVAVDATSLKGTGPYRVVSPSSEFDESTTGRPVRHLVPRKGRILLPGIETTLQRERYAPVLFANGLTHIRWKDVWKSITLATHPDHRTGRRGERLSVCECPGGRCH